MSDCCGEKMKVKIKVKSGCCANEEKPDSCCESGSNAGCCDSGDKRESTEEGHKSDCCGNGAKTGSCGCSGTSGTEDRKEAVKTTAELTAGDIFGTWKARWGMGRMDYRVTPGLYYVGSPDKNSPVLVTANYKMSFDALRKELKGIDAWILVLDTKGINVWCAAGKGTFGTEELVKRLGIANLGEVVSHRTLILPQLGAVGVSGFEVQKRTGFKVVYGPVRAKDLPEFLNNGMKATARMRTVEFGFIDRLVLTPMEFVSVIKPLFLILGVLFLLNSLGLGKYGSTDLAALLGAVLAGSVLTPAFLPWIPGRAFAWKGWLLGMLWILGLAALNGWFDGNLLMFISYLLVFPSISAYLAMNFTGASTYTSLSGVVKEMQVAVPFILITVVIGAVLLFTGNILRV